MSPLLCDGLANLYGDSTRSITFIQCAPLQSHFSLTLMLLSYYRNETKRVEGGGWFGLYIFGGWRGFGGNEKRDYSYYDKVS